MSLLTMKLVILFILIAGLCHSVSEANECTAAGKFPDDDGECRGFTLCLLGGTGFMQYNVTCPIGFVYTHMEQQCTNSTTYQCHPNFVCNTTGNFEDPSSKNCSSFIACIAGINTLVTARRIECPLKQTFAPVEGICTNRTDYQCNAGQVKANIPDPVGKGNNVTDFNVLVTEDEGIHISRNVSLNGAIKMSSKSALVLVVMLTFALN